MRVVRKELRPTRWCPQEKSDHSGPGSEVIETPLVFSHACSTSESVTWPGIRSQPKCLLTTNSFALLSTKALPKFLRRELFEPDGFVIVVSRPEYKYRVVPSSSTDTSILDSEKSGILLKHSNAPLRQKETSQSAGRRALKRGTLPRPKSTSWPIIKW